MTLSNSPLRWAHLAALAVLVAFAPTALGQAVIGSSLQDALSGTAALDQLEVVVTYDQAGPLSSAQRTALGSLGISTARFFESLPIAGALATPAQVADIAALPGVASVWLNEELTYSNDEARAITGVDRLRTDSGMRTSQGLPYSGKGVTVVVNDSGIDATHGDLPYGTKVVENVQALTNLNAVSGLLPITYLEGTQNTDTNSGHGTHCAGTVAGTGMRSGGLYEGVAPGADLIGYGSGGVILILDGLGGFDYAITHQFSFRNPIRVITNSWGSDGEFNPASPIVQASYRAYQRGITVLFAASNSGPGEDTHNIYAQAPWVMSVGAGDKFGALASFSSRGKKGEGYTFTTFDGVEWEYKNDVTIVAPGVDVTSARAATNAGANGGEGDVDVIAPAHLPFYTQISGTSMATPFVAGIVALMLEADPTLSPDDIKDILQRTATNMPGREAWEVGTGYVNAHAAVAEVLGIDVGDRAGFANATRDFNASGNFRDAGGFDVSLFFSPVGESDVHTFTVGADVSLVKARAIVSENTIALVLNSPSGKRYGSGITLPILGEIAGVSAPGEPGEWTITVRGIGSISGNAVDPLGVTNGYAAPGTIDATVEFVATDGFNGLDDVAGHPAQGFIESGVIDELFDGYADGTFRPDNALTFGELATYLTYGAGIRQPARQAPIGFIIADAVSQRGAALKDRAGFADGVLPASYNPSASVSNADLAYSLIAALGLHAPAAGYTGEVSVSYNGDRYVLQDSDAIPANRRGYVQLALDAGLMTARFSLEQGPFDVFPTLKARFNPSADVTRGAYAAAAVRLLDIYDTTNPEAFEGSTSSKGDTPSDLAQRTELDLEANAPNPFRGSTRIAFTTSASGPIDLAVYDLLGREVGQVVSGTMEAGRHEVSFDADGLAAGTYVYRLTSGGETVIRRMTVVR